MYAQGQRYAPSAEDKSPDGRFIRVASHARQLLSLSTPGTEAEHLRHTDVVSQEAHGDQGMV